MQRGILRVRNQGENRQVSKTTKLATVLKVERYHLVVQEADGAKHWLHYHGQVQMNTPREPGAQVALHWVHSAGGYTLTAAPVA